MANLQFLLTWDKKALTLVGAFFLFFGIEFLYMCVCVCVFSVCVCVFSVFSVCV